jgi:hypothetical protein
MDKNTIKTVFKGYIHPIDEKVVSKMVNHMELDKYIKKLNSLTFTKLFIYAQLKQIPSITKLGLRINYRKCPQEMVGLDNISKSQLSRKLDEVPPDIFQAILHHLIQKIHQEFGVEKGNELLGNIHLVNSTTISFYLSQYRWVDFRNTKAGVKIHTRVAFCEGITYLDKIVVTPARPADATQLDALVVVDKDTLYVFDRGYYDFESFDHYCETRTRFVTRIKEKAVINVIEEVPVAEESPILREATIKLGKMKHPLRLIETVDSKGNKISIVTNDAKISTQEISDLYRNRWQFELSFKWMKQHLILKKCYGKSSNAIYNQIYIAMITFCLTLLMKKKVNYLGTLWDLQLFLEEYWDRSFNVFLKELFKKPKRSSMRRRSIDYERIFKETLAQFENGEMEHLNDQTYDPIY